MLPGFLIQIIQNHHKNSLSYRKSLSFVVYPNIHTWTLTANKSHQIDFQISHASTDSRRRNHRTRAYWCFPRFDTSNSGVAVVEGSHTGDVTRSSRMNQDKIIPQSALVAQRATNSRRIKRLRHPAIWAVAKTRIALPSRDSVHAVVQTALRRSGSGAEVVTAPPRRLLPSGVHLRSGRRASQQGWMN